VVKSSGIRLGLIVVPAQHAQAVAERLVAAGIEGIVNFAPVTLSLPPQVQIVAVDLAIELEQLSFAVTSKLAKATAESAHVPTQGGSADSSPLPAPRP
jgi:redox-sensing transcriptional repressor